MKIQKPILFFFIFSKLFLIASSLQAAQSRFPCIATAGTTRCLVIFTKFKDDEFGRDLSQDGAECLQDSINSWPWYVNDFPAFAKKIIDSVATDSPTTGSLTEYFYQMSGGKFYLIGDIYPDLIIPVFEQKHYYRKNGRGIGWFDRKLLEALDPKIDFRRYDTNPVDGKADMIALLFRLLKARRFEGEHYQGKAFLGGFKTITLDSIEISGKNFGSGFTSTCSHFTSVKLLAHEIGHFLFGGWHRYHIGAFGLMGNDGYSAMCAREREFLGWLEPRIITQTTLNDTLHDLTTTGDARKIYLNDEAYLLLANRQRISFFEKQIDQPCKAGELPATGLVITYVSGPRISAFSLLAPDGEITGKGDAEDAWQPDRDDEFDSRSHPGLKTLKNARQHVRIEKIRSAGTDLVFNIFIDQ